MSNLVLVGLPGSGKTFTGRLLATATGRTFVDLDHLFAEEHGRTPAEVIRQDGESAFRSAEAALAQRVARRSGQVIATGGGAVLDPLTRWALWHSGPVIWLDAPDEVLAARLAVDAVDRPLAAGLEEIARRRAERERFYAAADHHITGVRSPGATVTAIVEAVGDGATPSARTLVNASVRRDHQMGPREARIILGHRLDADSLAGLVSEASSGIPVVVADENVAAAQPGIVGAFPGERLLTIDAGERNKRLSSAEAMLEFAFSRRAERKDAWVAIGGGTTGDLVGVAAALYMRGAPLVQVPTTWLAMSDAAIGGKVGVDLAAAKNSAGAFWPPVAVVADVAAIETLTPDLRLDGMAECLKSGIIGDPWLWDLVSTRGISAMASGEEADLAARYAIVERSALLKVGVVDRDPFELGERRNLNLGHTIGHALEIESGYTLPHGKAVVLGTRAVTHMAVGRGAPKELAEEIDDVLARLGYPMTRAFDADAVTAALAGDKKSSKGKIRWILPTAIGEVEQADDVTPAEVAAALTRIQENS